MRGAAARPTRLAFLESLDLNIIPNELPPLVNSRPSPPADRAGRIWAWAFPPIVSLAVHDWVRWARSPASICVAIIRPHGAHGKLRDKAAIDAANLEALDREIRAALATAEATA